MSIFDNQPPGLLDYVESARLIKEDKANLDEYITSIQGAGLESFGSAPAHKLIEQGLADRYPAHFKMGSGTEGLILLAAVLGGGYIAYKKMMRAKNNPVLKNTAEAEKAIDKTYTAAWLEGKESVGKPVKVSYLSSIVPGDDFSKASTTCNDVADNLSKSIIDVVDKAMAAWKKIEPIAREWLAAADDEGREAAHAKLKAAYPEAPYLTLSKEIKFPARIKGPEHTFEPLSKEDYPKAVALMKYIVSCFDTVDDQGERVWDEIGLWDEFDKTESKWPGVDDFYDCAYAENIHDYFGRDLFSARNTLLDISRGLEEWIVKSFK